MLIPLREQSCLIVIFIVKYLNHLSTTDSIMYIPQLIQVLQIDVLNYISKFLKSKAFEVQIFSHYLIWNIWNEKGQVRGKNDKLIQVLAVLEFKIDKIWMIQAVLLFDMNFLIRGFWQDYRKNFDISISERITHLHKFLKEIEMSQDLYVPSNPTFKISDIDLKSSKVLKSFISVPILINFKTNQGTIASLFKPNDDILQDLFLFFEKLELIVLCIHIKFFRRK
jgi:hypothetical protein